MKRKIVSMLSVVIVFAFGCSTSARFIIPDRTELVVHGKKAVPDEDGPAVIVKMHPFFWSSFSGIDYQLIRKDAVVREGKVQAGFRIAALFWPPYALLYWPAGFRYSCYDLTKAVPMTCEKPAPPVKQDTSTSGAPWSQ